MEKEEKTLQEHLVIIEWLFLIGFGIMLLPALIQSDLWTWILMFSGLGIMVAGVLYSGKYFRCPHCGSKLDPRRKVPNYCPDCGKKLI